MFPFLLHVYLILPSAELFDRSAHVTSSLSHNEHCSLSPAPGNTVLPTKICFCFFVMLLLLMYVRLTGDTKPTCGVVCFFFFFYRDVEGAEPAAQSERVYRPENNCWRQRVWSPPKCSSFLQLVFQGPGEKVCLRFPPPPTSCWSNLFFS